MRQPDSIHCTFHRVELLDVDMRRQLLPNQWTPRQRHRRLLRITRGEGERNASVQIRPATVADQYQHHFLLPSTVRKCDVPTASSQLGYVNQGKYRNERLERDRNIQLLVIGVVREGRHVPS